MQNDKHEELYRLKKLTRHVIVAFISAVGLVNCTPIPS